jgi:hypothetical protein
LNLFKIDHIKRASNRRRIYRWPHLNQLRTTQRVWLDWTVKSRVIFWNTLFLGTLVVAKYRPQLTVNIVFLSGERSLCSFKNILSGRTAC